MFVCILWIVWIRLYTILLKIYIMIQLIVFWFDVHAKINECKYLCMLDFMSFYIKHVIVGKREIKKYKTIK